MGPTTVMNTMPYTVMRGTCDIEILAKCRDWDDAVKIAERHPNARIFNSENETWYDRHERIIVEYTPKGE